MKILSRKTIIIAAIALALTVAAVFYLRSHNSASETSVFVDPAFAAYISSYTTGVLPSGSSLKITFPRDVADSAMFGRESDERLFDFSPALSGKTVWLDSRTIEFRPEKRMQAGQRYTATFFLSKLIEDLPEALSSFQYTFRIIPQNYEVMIVNTKSYSKDDLSRAKIEGVLNTADFADASAVEESIEASQQGRDLSLTWIHENEGRQHHFVVEDVNRGDNTATVNIRVDGKVIGAVASHDLAVEIPSLNEFKLVDTRVVQSPSQYVVLQFSDPLKENQNLAGLITIEDLPSLDFDIHDNEVWVYPPVHQNGRKTIRISEGIRNVQNKKMAEATVEEIVFEQVHPAVRFVGKGSILPSTDGLVVPFEAVNLNAVDVQVIRIYEENVLQFLQVNNIEGSNELRRVGRRIIRKKIPLLQTGVTDPGKWNRFTLDVAELINAEPGAIYEIRLSFKKEYSIFACSVPLADAEESGQFEQLSDDFDDGYGGSYYFDYNDHYYYGDDFDWRQRDNPCHSSYYTSNRSVTKNILASDLGLTVKRGEDGGTVVFVNDLKSTNPIAGVDVALYSFQLQVLGTAKTDNEGRVIINSKEAPFAVVARLNSQRGYLRLANGEALMTSNFDVSGQVVQKGLKGFLYGERGVWRPGDSLYLTFILEDKRKIFPAHHPVVFELSNPRGQVMNRIVRASSENGFYNFATATAADAPTGNWLGRVKVGGSEFTQTLKIETVKPNRLKIDLDFGVEKFTSPDISGVLNVKWLHGAPGRNLNAEYEVMLMRQTTEFEGYAGFNFDDPSRTFVSESQLIFDGKTDAQGNAAVNGTLERSGEPSGLLNAVFRGKVYEDGGNFSIDRFSLPFYPYENFVGISVPEGEQYSGILYTDVDHNINIASVDAEGNPTSRKGLELNLYKLEWRWWWDNTSESLANFLEGSYAELVKSATINTTNGKAQWRMNLEAAQYGRYFLRVCDPVSGHCAGEVIYVDEPGWWSRARSDDARGGANLLSLSTDRTEYNIGEKIQVTIPGIGAGRALVSIEDGSKVIETHWVETQKAETRFTFDAVAGMAPNVYIHVSLLQPHDQSVNDLPIRLYGVTSVKVADPDSHLSPQIQMPDVLRPGEAVSIRVSEKNDQPMTFTVAMVDEGLLDLTRFKTPDAWSVFYAREALGVRTWDVYDHVMGAYGANLERFISIGGDDAIATGEVDPLANRFKPVVKFFGPFTIDGGSKDIQFTMPQYIGSVKTMVVAGNGAAYGSAEKVSTVKKPLMVLATLPRVLGSDETVSLPVTVFAGEKDLSNVNVTAKASGPVTVSIATTSTIDLKANSDTTIDLRLSVKGETGIATIEVQAVSGSLTATDVIQIQVRNPNLPITRVTDALLEAGQSFNTVIQPFGLRGTNSAVLEISNLPAINLDSRMRYLLQYPHGCIEQITSAVFPQLYLAELKALTDAEKQTIESNIKSAVEQLRSFVQADGGFGYWPRLAESTDSWGTSYAGHFLVQAESKGYFVPADMINRWKNFQRTRANAWRRNEAHYNSDLLQAYRLYTLALAAAPEMGAMNRLREEKNLSSTAAWMLASAYAVAGQTEAARTLTRDLSQVVKPYREMGYTYGSHLRDKALILETLILLNDDAKALDILKEVANALGNDDYWMSTQETAMCVRAFALFAAEHGKGELKFDYRLSNGKTIEAGTGLPLAQIQVPVSSLQEILVSINNKSKGVLFARVIATGTPARGQEENEASDLVMQTRYADLDGNEIDPSQLEQGSQFIAEVTVRHPGIRSAYENVALSQVFPSGWEINNLRLTEDEAFLQMSTFTYQDIRDDRVFTYFNLAPHEEKIFRVSLTAAYAGSYYLPGPACEAMYDASVYARKKGRTVSVAKRGQ